VVEAQQGLLRTGGVSRLEPEALSLGPAMSSVRQLVVFRLGDSRYALPLQTVERVVPVVEITPLPKAPPIVLGAVNLGGRILPVLDIRKRFRLPDRDLELEDQLIVARGSDRMVALLVDRVTGVVARPAHEVVAAATVAPGLDYVEGIAKLEDGLVLIHNLDTFLSLDEEAALADALTCQAITS
jgi:purine-binding chemotaxis protein CheW